MLKRLNDYMAGKGYRFATQPGELNIIAIEGMSPDAKCNADTPNVFNDLLVVTDHKLQWLDKFVCTTEPGRFYTNQPMNPRGAARLAFGQHTAWQVGMHFNERALAQTGGPVTVHRDGNRDFMRPGDSLDTGYFGINVHHGGNAPLSDIGRWSAGCIVVPSTKQFNTFLALVETDVRYRRNRNFVFTITLVPCNEL